MGVLSIDRSSWKKTIDLEEYTIEENEDEIRVIDANGKVIVTHNKSEKKI